MLILGTTDSFKPQSVVDEASLSEEHKFNHVLVQQQHHVFESFALPEVSVEDFLKVFIRSPIQILKVMKQLLFISS